MNQPAMMSKRPSNAQVWPWRSDALSAWVKKPWIPWAFRSSKANTPAAPTTQQNCNRTLTMRTKLPGTVDWSADFCGVSLSRFECIGGSGDLTNSGRSAVSGQAGNRRGLPPSSMRMINRQAQRCRAAPRHYPDVNRWTKVVGFLNYLWGTVMYAGGGYLIHTAGGGGTVGVRWGSRK